MSIRDEQVSPEPVLPVTVAASHLAACADALANATAGSGVTDLGELAGLVADLLAGQRQIAATLANLAETVDDRGELGTLAEVLGAASAATGHAADALAAGGSVLAIVLSGGDTAAG